MFKKRNIGGDPEGIADRTGRIFDDVTDFRGSFIKNSRKSLLSDSPNLIRHHSGEFVYSSGRS